MIESLIDRPEDHGYGTSPSIREIVRLARLSYTQPETAFAALTPIVDGSRRSAEPADRGLAGLVRARILANRGDYHWALATLQGACNDLRIAGMPLEVVRANITILRSLRGIGQVQRSIDDAMAMLDRWTLDVPTTSRVTLDLNARLQTELSCSLVVMGRHDEALHRLDHAWNRFRASADAYMATVCERSRGEAYLGLGLLHRAVEDLERAQQTFERLGHPLDAARCVIPRASALTRLGRGAEAVPLLEEIRAVLEHHGARGGLARLGLALNDALLSVGLAWDARAEAREASEHYLALLRGEDAARAHLQAALASMVIGEPDVARREIDGARRLLLGSEAPQLRIATLLLDATVARNEGDTAAATDGAEAAIALADQHEGSVHPSLRASALLLAAHEDKDLELASRRLDEASLLVSELGLTRMRLSCALSEARLSRHENETDKAASILRDALVTHLRDGLDEVVGDEPSTGPFALAMAFDELVGLLIRQGTPRSLAEAWRWTSVSKTVMSDDYVAAIMRHRRSETHASRQAPSFSTDPAFHRLSRQLDLVGSGDLGAATDLRQAQNDARRVLRRHLRQTRDLSQTVIPTPDAPIPEGPLLQLHVLGDDVAVLVIREGQVYARCLSGAAGTSRRLLSQWWIECSRLAHLGVESARADPTDPSDPVRQLAALLLEPVADLLVDLPDGAPLAVVGHQHLDELPMEAMLLDGSPMSERFSLRFVVGLDPSILPSSSSTTSPVPDPVAPSTSPDPVEGEKRAGVLVLAVPDEAAPAIAEEAEGIRRLRDDATVLVGADATSEVLASRAGSYDVVHLACHGLFDEEQPRGSGIRLGDRWLLAGEIMDADLTDTVVVLNACATGRVAKSATDMGGLVWSFLAAGCAGVVSTTWPVSDEVATCFALAFHEHLAAGVDPAAAVDAARAQVARRHRHPWQWAAFRHTSAGELVLHV